MIAANVTPANSKRVIGLVLLLLLCHAIIGGLIFAFSIGTSPNESLAAAVIMGLVAELLVALCGLIAGIIISRRNPEASRTTMRFSAELAIAAMGAFAVSGIVILPLIEM